MKKKIIFLESLIAVLVIFPLLGLAFEGLKNDSWIDILLDSNNIESLVVTTQILLLVIILNIAIGTPLAISMVKHDFKFKYLIEILIYLPLIIPALVSTIGIQYFFIKINIIDTILGVAIIHSISTLPYYIQSIRVGYKTINGNYEKLGKILGLNPIQIFFKIIFPMIIPSFIVGISLVTMASLAQYITTYIIGGGVVNTYPMFMMPYLMDGNIVTGSVYSFWYLLYSFIMILGAKFLLKQIYSKEKREKR